MEGYAGNLFFRLEPNGDIHVDRDLTTDPERERPVYEVSDFVHYCKGWSLLVIFGLSFYDKITMCLSYLQGQSYKIL